MSKAKTGNKVKVHFKGTTGNGEVFQESKEMGQPLEFIIGEGTLLAGFEKNVEGLEVGGTKTFTLESKIAYGERIEDAVIKVPRESFPPDFKLTIDDVIQGETSGGQPALGRVKSITEEEVTLDMNHPLAGEDVTFEVELIEIVN